MRRPQATTVSAARTSVSFGAEKARAFSDARRSAYSRGSSALRGVSSIAAGTTASGTIPACASSARRRGLSLASTKRGAGLFEAIGDASFGKVIRSHLHHDLVAGQHADAVLAHLARGVGDDLMSVGQHDAKRRVGQQFADRAFKLKQFFFCHYASGWGLTAGDMAQNPAKSKPNA